MVQIKTLRKDHLMRVERADLRCRPIFAWKRADNEHHCLLTFSVQPLHRNVQRFRGGLVLKAHRLLYHSMLGLRVIKKEKEYLFSRSSSPWMLRRSLQSDSSCPPSGTFSVGQSEEQCLEGRYKATWKRKFKLPWRDPGPTTHLNDKVDSDQ